MWQLGSVECYAGLELWNWSAMKAEWAGRLLSWSNCWVLRHWKLGVDMEYLVIGSHQRDLDISEYINIYKYWRNRCTFCCMCTYYSESSYRFFHLAVIMTCAELARLCLRLLFLLLSFFFIWGKRSSYFNSSSHQLNLKFCSLREQNIQTSLFLCL